MDLNVCYEVAAPEVVDEDFGGEIVVLNLSDGRYFSLRGVAATLWRDVRAGHVPGEIVRAVSDAGETLAQEVADYFKELVQASLIRPRLRVPEDAPAGAAAVSELLAEHVAPVMEVYDDMAELILSDPIHDVEEDIGWPVRRETN